MSAWMISSSSGKPASKLSIYDPSELQDNARTSGETAREKRRIFPPLALASPFACCSCVTSRDSPKWRACSLAKFPTLIDFCPTCLSGLFILQLITKFPAINGIKFSWRGSTPGSTGLTKSDTFFMTNLFLIIKTLSKLKSGQYPKGITQKTKKGDLFILDPRLFSDNRMPSCYPGLFSGTDRSGLNKELPSGFSTIYCSRNFLF